MKEDFEEKREPSINGVKLYEKNKRNEAFSIVRTFIISAISAGLTVMVISSFSMYFGLSEKLMSILPNDDRQTGLTKSEIVAISNVDYPYGTAQLLLDNLIADRKICVFIESPDNEDCYINSGSIFSGSTKIKDRDYTLYPRNKLRRVGGVETYYYELANTSYWDSVHDKRVECPLWLAADSENDVFNFMPVMDVKESKQLIGILVTKK